MTYGLAIASVMLYYGLLLLQKYTFTSIFNFFCLNVSVREKVENGYENLVSCSQSFGLTSEGLK